ncbi:oligosaccharide flippase family protein [Cereibacter sp. SYSU M97828]|nr:oligosaccharide flippase family protein [Cereibacter flavus]
MRLSIGASAVDVALRLAAQMGSTVVIARLLSPEDFGLAILVLSVVGVIGALVGLPFEEALAQRRRLSTAHLETTLFVSLLLAVGAVGIAFASGPLLAHLAGIEAVAFWLPLATLFLVGQGPGTVARALARRHERFVDLAICQSVSTVIGCVVAVGFAVQGQGILALVLQRMLPIVLFPLLAMALATWHRRQVLVRPRWNRARLDELFRFSWINLADVGVDYATPAVLTFLVNAHFGTAVLGQLNIAMRMVDPLRAAIGSVGHNIAFAMLMRMQGDPAKLGAATAGVVVNVAAFSVPAFLGLAVCAPILLPLLVGAGWGEAVPMARILCLMAAVSVPFRYFYSGYSALGRPEYGLWGSLLGLAAMILWIEFGAVAGAPGAVATSLLVAEGVSAALAVALLLPLARHAARDAMIRMLRIWAATVLMASSLHWIFLGENPQGGIELLLAMIATGMLLYPLLLLAFCRDCFDRLRIAMFSGGRS